jgi:hypothetical protein
MVLLKLVVPHPEDLADRASTTIGRFTGEEGNDRRHPTPLSRLDKP